MWSWFALEWSDAGADDYAGGLVLRDVSGEVLRVSLGPGDVDCRPYYAAARSDWIVQALVAAEDGTYFEHPGVRPLSILRAAWQNVSCGQRISGASTLTMQAVRLIHPHPKSYLWKFREAVLALKLERRHDKEWILSQYLNRAPFGSNFIGIEAAAHGWFGKGAKELSIAEAAMLAGMVQAPSRFRPDRGYERALKRRDYVLRRMRTLGMITDEQLEGARSVKPVLSRSPRPFRFPFYCDWVMRELGRDRESQRHGGDVVTALDSGLEERVEAAVNAAAARGGYHVAAVVMRVDTGAVKALAVSGDYFSDEAGQVNTALAPRPAGSTLKPFLSAQALDLGLVTSEEMLADVPRSFQGYRPANFDSRYRGRVTLRRSLIESLNLPFVELLSRVGVERHLGLLRQLGFRQLKGTAADYGLGLAIGNAEVTLMELTAAYATLARGGQVRRSSPVAAPGAAGGQAFSAAAAYLVSDLISGEERSLEALGHQVAAKVPRFAWKTGTSAGFRDAWTLAWNPEYVVGVWCGHLRGGFGDETLVGLKAAAPVATAIFRSLYPRNEGPWYVEPAAVARRQVCAKTGLPLGPGCPEAAEGRYLKGISSTRPCEVHRLGADGKVEINEDPAILRFERSQSALALAIVSPAANSTIRLVPGIGAQQLVGKVRGNPPESRLWWFLDGVPVGETLGGERLVAELKVGRHCLSCATAEGVGAQVEFTVEE